jgi:ABC-2 type transport system permease protein
MLFMLALAMLIVPALTAQSINGDRERGVLATLQTTLLTPAEIAIGKLVAAWATTLVFLAVSLPLIVWCLVEGGVSVGRVIGTLIATALLLGGRWRRSRNVCPHCSSAARPRLSCHTWWSSP